VRGKKTYKYRNIVLTKYQDALNQGGYQISKRGHVGLIPGAGRCQVDLVTSTNRETWLVAVTAQEDDGTAENKVPYTVMCLAKGRLDNPDCRGAYLIIEGPGWKLKDFYLGGGLAEYLVHHHLVKIVDLDQFTDLAKRDAL